MRTVVGLFDSWSQAQSTVRDLEASGFDRNDINVIAHAEVLAEGNQGAAMGAGAAIGAGLGLLAGLSLIAVPGFGVVAAIGPIVATGILGAVAGGLVGSLVDAGVPMGEAQHYAEGVRRGGTLVVVNASDDDCPRAIEVINRHNPVDLDERVLNWRQGGAAPETTAPPPMTATATAAPADQPDPTGHTTMGDAAAAAPTLAVPPVAPVLSPAPDLQPTRESAPADRPIAPAAVNAANVACGDEVFRTMEDDFRDDFDREFPGDYTWDECGPAYQFGCELACDSPGPTDWSDVEPNARQRWERSHPGTWDRVKDAAHYAYDRARSTV
ncbi:MAG TPA: hypothetical protein VGI81_29435 [Tepidisphaeraceae bacterium]|jgi:hypothetical protein